MRSFLSRLGSLRRAPDEETPAWSDQARGPEPQASQPDRPSAASPRSLRLGVDFGTSTIQVAVRIGTDEPRLVRLEDATDHLPSYFAFDSDGAPAFGARAQNLPVNVHSIKPLLDEDQPLAAVGGRRPSDLAYLMLKDVVARTLARLRAEGVLPAEVDRLEIATNLGCSPRFSLATRGRLRDVAQKAGLNVARIVDLVEEPVAAAFEAMFSGLASDGRLLVIDVGGGTLDVAVLRGELGSNHFELYATRGSEHAGDRLTEAIVARVRQEIAQRLGPAYGFTHADETLAWQRAEAAKLALSVRPTAILPLGGIGGLEQDDIEITGAWFEAACRPLRPFIQEDVRVAYLLARLVLDRGGPDDPDPGTVDLGSGRRLTDLRVSDGLTKDALEHIDSVVLVGGGSRSPMIRRLVEEMFPGRVLDPELLGIDPVSVVALGLARGERLDASSLRFPNWGIRAAFRTAAGRHETLLYEPYAPAFKVDGGRTSEYEAVVPIPPGATEVALEFLPIGGASGERSEPIALGPSARALGICLTLFGDLDVTIRHETGSATVQAVAVPWRPREGARYADWLVHKRDETAPFWDWPDDAPG